MRFESESGIGSTFSFSLPVGEVEEEATLQRGSSRWINPYAIQEGRTRPFRAPVAAVLPCCVVFEVGDGIRHLFERYLDGYEIIPVQDVPQLITEIGQPLTQTLVINHPDYETICHSLSTQNQLPYGLTLFAFWLPGIASVAKNMNVKQYLVKPVSTETLLETLEGFGGEIQDILLVDDNPDILQLFGRIISSAKKSYKVLRATDGQQGLDLLRTRKPDLVFLDLVMPEMDGFQLLREKEADLSIRDIPVVVLTAQDPVIVTKAVEMVAPKAGRGDLPADLLTLVRTMSLNAGSNPKLD